MVTVSDVLRELEQFAPIGRKMDFDNVGFLAGRSGAEVRKVLVALDITPEVILEAEAERAQLIVSHHPMFFSLKNVTDLDENGLKAVMLLERGIAGICMHTNLDAAVGGVNDALAEAIGLRDCTLLSEEGFYEGEPFSYGRAGYLEKPVPMAEFLPFLKDVLHTNGLRYHDAGRPVHYVASVGGSGGSDLGAAIARGCDTMITADIKYDVFLSAKQHGVNLIDADHFCTENTVVPRLKKRLSEAFPALDVVISRRHGQTVQFF